jgi:hypothetical protein
VLSLDQRRRREKKKKKKKKKRLDFIIYKFKVEGKDLFRIYPVCQ